MIVAVGNRQRLFKVDTRLLATIAERVVELTKGSFVRLSIALVSDATIAKLNSQYHDTHGPTDILSFNYGKGEGELIVSVEHAVAHARRFRTTASRELVLYVVHGILHLRGYDDVRARDRRRMRSAEQKLMSNLRRQFEFQGLLSRRAVKR